jgi:2-oxoglutarate ferredoxin oxidoreductase subunit gamma
MNNTKVLNMIMLGAFIQVTSTVKIDTIWKALELVLPERYHKLIPINQEAFKTGMGLILN